MLWVPQIMTILTVGGASQTPATHGATSGVERFIPAPQCKNNVAFPAFIELKAAPDGECKELGWGKQGIIYHGRMVGATGEHIVKQIQTGDECEVANKAYEAWAKMTASEKEKKGYVVNTKNPYCRCRFFPVGGEVKVAFKVEEMAVGRDVWQIFFSEEELRHIRAATIFELVANRVARKTESPLFSHNKTAELMAKDIYWKGREALRFLHTEVNYCHGDINGKNLMYDVVEKTLNLIDFGESHKIGGRGFRGLKYFRIFPMFFETTRDQLDDFRMLTDTVLHGRTSSLETAFLFHNRTWLSLSAFKDLPKDMATNVKQTQDRYKHLMSKVGDENIRDQMSSDMKVFLAFVATEGAMREILWDFVSTEPIKRVVRVLVAVLVVVPGSVAFCFVRK